MKVWYKYVIMMAMAANIACGTPRVPEINDPRPLMASPEVGTYVYDSGLAFHAVLTAYCSCPICCGRWSGGPTASGAYPVEGITVAADLALPFGTIIEIDGRWYIVEDTGSAIKGAHFDIYMEDHERARKFGVRDATVRIVSIPTRDGRSWLVEWFAVSPWQASQWAENMVEQYGRRVADMTHAAHLGS